MKTLITLLGVLCLIPPMLFYSDLSWGFVVSKLYAWFVLSSIPNLPNFTFLQFIGFSVFLGALMPQYTEHIKEEYKDKSTIMTMFIIRPWIVLLCGWIISLFY